MAAAFGGYEGGVGVLQKGRSACFIHCVSERQTFDVIPNGIILLLGGGLASGESPLPNRDFFPGLGFSRFSPPQ